MFSKTALLLISEQALTKPPDGIFYEHISENIYCEILKSADIIIRHVWSQSPRLILFQDYKQMSG